MALHSYRDKTFLSEHPEITITTLEGETLVYRIFAVRQMRVTDKLFTLFNKNPEDIEKYFSEHDAPAGTKRFLVLSTCMTGGSDDDRLLVFAALE